MYWSLADIADALEAGLRQRAQDDDLEQAVYGFDALDELGLHPVLHASLGAAGWGVHPEQRYPGDRTRRRRSEGKRCDIVLTPDDRPLREPDVARTLFDDPAACDLDRAYWLEIKTVAQFETGGPFRHYSKELLSPVTQDVKKIFGDSLIRFGGLALVLFTADERIADHDLGAWHNRCLEKGYPVGPPITRGFAITERIGNAWCGIGVYGIRGV